MKNDNSFVGAVQEFHLACGYDHSNQPSAEDLDRRKLWAELIREEVNELQGAITAADLEKIADGLGDTIYVCIGAALGFGIPIEEVFFEIHRSNMSKIGSDGKVQRRPDGKILRGENYAEPDIGRVLRGGAV